MKPIKKKEDEGERLFNTFITNLEAEGFDIKVFDKNKIKRNFGRGLYKQWEECLRVFKHRKIVIIFEGKTSKSSWPSDGYPNRIVINLAHAPNVADFQKAENEFFQLESALSELKSL